MGMNETNDRKQEGPYKGVETQGKGRQSLTIYVYFSINECVLVVLITNNNSLMILVTSITIQNDFVARKYENINQMDSPIVSSLSHNPLYNYFYKYLPLNSC